MSHFTVGVIIKEKDIIEKEKEESLQTREEIIASLVADAMEPFSETYEVEPYLVKTEEELQEDLENVINYEGDSEWHLKMKEKYKDASLQEFCEQHLGHIYKEDGAYSTNNPNGKWDFYVIGGRWNRELPIKNRQMEVDEEYSIYADNVEDNMCQIKDLELTKRLSKEELDKLAEEYNDKIKNGDMIYTAEHYINQFPTLGHYIDYSSSYTTYAILTSDGQWIEPGEVGNFGYYLSTCEQETNFHRIFRECINKHRPEDYIVLIDCHV